jgi:hypothetical protein
MIALLTMYPRKRVIHLFLDNARYHHAKLVQAWLAQPSCRIKLHFIPTYCPHPRSASRPKPIERLWGLMHKHITHNTGLFNALYIRGPRVSPRCNSCAKHASRPDRRIPARQDL